MAGPYSERQELEDLRKMKRLEELEAKASGRSVSAPAQAAPQSPSPFLQRGMNMVQGAMESPVTGKEAALDARNEQIKTRQDLTGKAMRAIRDVQDIQRKRRVDPVEKAAGEAGRTAMGDAPLAGNPSYMPSEFMLPPDAQRGMQAEREVYRANDVTSSVDAASIRGLNMAAGGLPGILNKDFRGELAAAGNDQPGAALTGDVLGFLPFGIGMWNAVRAPVNAAASRFIPQGADAGSRGVRYVAPRVGEVTGAAGQNAYFQAAGQEPIRAETAGEDLTLGGMAAAAARGLQDPLNFAPAVLSGVNRTWNLATSGIATPSARAAQMANQYGVGPRQTSASQGIAQTTQQLGGQLQGADIRGLTNIENALRFALRDNPNIRDVNARIATGFERIRQSLPLEDDPTLNLARLIEREFAPDAPQTRDIIRNFLSSVGLNSPGGAQIVGDAANQMRGQQADALRTEVESAFGAQPRTEANAAIQGSLDQFSTAYNTVLGSAPRQGPQVDRARQLLAREPQTMAILDDLAQSQNMTAEQFIERNPLQALHEVQSELAAQARALQARGDAAAGPLEITVRNMQRPLREGVPGYGELQGLWRQWTQARERMGYVRGAEAGTAGELTKVPGFGEKVIGPGGVSSSEMGTQTAADAFLQMDELSQRAAGLSVRDVISDELRKMKAAGPNERYQAAANMRRVATEGGLDALRRVFGEAGDRVARRIEQFIDANEFARDIDPLTGSNTMNKGQKMATGAQPFAGPMGQATQGAANSMTQNAAGDVLMMASGITSAPVLSAMRAVPWLANRLQPSQRTQRNIAQTLLRRGEIGSQVPPPPAGPLPIMPIDPTAVPGAVPPPGGSTPPPGGPVLPANAPPSPARPIAAGGFAGLTGSDAMPGAIGGFIGFNQDGEPITADNIGEKLRNAAIGTGVGLAANRIGPRQARNAFADTASGGLPGGGPRKPLPPPPPKRRNIGTKVADASAVAMLAAGGPTAEADTPEAQNERINELMQREASAQQTIAEYEQGLKAFRAMSVTEKQQFLRDNGIRDADGQLINPDGSTGPRTTEAIEAYTARLDAAIAKAKAEREGILGEVNDIRVSQAEQDENPPNPWIDKALEFGSYGAALYGAHRFRSAALRGSQKSARAIEDQANSLLTRLPVPPPMPDKTLLSRVPIVGNNERARIAAETKTAAKAASAVEERLSGRKVPPISPDNTSPDGLPTRIENLQQFYRKGGAEGNLPFEDLGNGQFAPRTDATPEYRLYGPKGPIGRFMEPVTSRFRTSDAVVMGAGATDATVMEGMLEKTRADITDTEAELEAARKANNPTRIRAARDRLKELRNIETLQITAQRVGIGLVAGGALGVAHGKYARPEPRFEAAGRERQLINQAISPAPVVPPPPPILPGGPQLGRPTLVPPPPPPKKSRGPNAPRQKPPVTITTGKRTRKPSNDND